jgi:hypothetical protein
LVVVNVIILAAQLVDEPFEPMQGDAYEGPQPAANFAKAGGTLHVGPVTKCNTSSTPVISIGTVTWRRLAPTSQFVAGGTFTVVKDPGCVTQEYDNIVPDLAPGTWELHGEEQIVGPNNEVQRLGWRTEPFEVVGG